MDKLPESAGHFEEVSDKIYERVLLNHEFEKLEQIATFSHVTNVEYLKIRKFPIINILYKNTPITMVTTQMGVDNTLWVADALLFHHVNKFVKFGSFISLNPTINKGDIYLPDEAVALPGPIEVYVDIQKTNNRVSTNGDFLEEIQQKAKSLKIENIGSGSILTYPILRIKTDYPEYNINKWKNNCFGLEMECAGLFAVINHFNSKEEDANKKAKAAAVLICNREGYRLDLFETSEKKSISKEGYALQYKKAIELSLEALI